MSTSAANAGVRSNAQVTAQQIAQQLQSAGVVTTPATPTTTPSVPTTVTGATTVATTTPTSGGVPSAPPTFEAAP